MTEKPDKFKKCVQKCLRYHILAINKLVEDGMIFWDYGNGLQSEAKKAGKYLISVSMKSQPSAFTNSA